jgi:alpha-mannosidase
MRNLERILTTAEKLSALASWLGFPADNGGLTGAWEPVLFNQAHDLASGTMVDKVYEDTIRGYQFSKSLGDATVETDIDEIASKIDTRTDGLPVVVFNSLGWPRSDIVEVDIGFSEAGSKFVELTGPSGEAVPIQYLETERYGQGGIKHAKIAFIARDVPALGYSVYQVTSKHDGSMGAAGSAVAGFPTTAHEDFGSIENENYRADFDLWTGEMIKLRVKAGDWEALGGRPANVVEREQDGGDFWELYGNLDAARFTAMTRKQGLSTLENTHFSKEWVGGDGTTEQGPVFSQFHITHPFGGGSFETSVKLYPGIHRIDFRTDIVNNDKLVRYRILFPTSIKNGQRFDEIPFGAIERPLAQEFPAQNWIDYSDGTKGVALINRGLPGNNVADGTLMVSLMRSVASYEQGAPTDYGLELGVKRTFDYAIVPHEGDWRAAEVYRAGWEFNNPLLVRKVAVHAGSLPKRWGLLEVSQRDAVVSALKPGRDGRVVLRVYEAAGHPSSAVKIKLNAAISSLREVNLLEDGSGELKTANDAFQFDLGPYQIKTFSLKLRPLNAGK